MVVPKYGLVGGAEQFVREVTERLARQEHYEFHVFANRWQATNGSPVVFHKVPIIRFPRWLRPVSFAWFAQRLIARGGFDLIHSHDRIFRADVVSLHCVPHAGWVRSVRRKTPSLYDRAVIAVERRLVRNGADSWFLPVSSLALESFQQAYRVLPGHWQVVHPGVDLARFSAPDRMACRAEIRGRYGIGPADLLILFVGMNFEVKGLDTILAAVAKARATQPAANIRLLVVGRGNVPKYVRIAQSLGIAEAVTFAGTQAEGIERYYRAADLFIMLSTFDTFGMVVLEALAAGLPVIVSKHVGAKDLVEEGVSGFVVSGPQDSGATAARITQMLDVGQRDALGAAARQRALAHDWDATVAELEGVYRKALSRQHRLES